MRTRIIRIAPEDWADDGRLAEQLAPAAACLRQGGLVAFPTETVYGLGASAWDPEAARRIYAAKGRPQDNPLIVHVARSEQLLPLCRELPPLAQALFRRFAPGPFSCILPKSPKLPMTVTGGLDTVALRIPSHPVARRLLSLADLPVAAPSANRSGLPSPTEAQHVCRDLEGRVDYIIDAGSCDFGLESTVLDLSQPRQPRILRPGALSAEEVLDFLQNCPDFQAEAGWEQRLLEPGRQRPELGAGERPLAPGMKYRHYAPKKPLLLVESLAEAEAAIRLRLETEGAEQQAPLALYVAADWAEHLRRVLGTGLWARLRPVWTFAPEAEHREAAQKLFWALRSYDESPAQLLLVQALDERGLGLAYMNRLRKAASPQRDIQPETAVAAARDRGEMSL